MPDPSSEDKVDEDSPQSVPMVVTEPKVPDEIGAYAQRPRGITIARRAFAILGLIGGLVVALLGMFPDCAIEVAAGGTSETCEPIAIGSAKFILWVALIALLLAPDLDEIEFGGVKLRRRIDKVSAEAEKLQQKFDKLELEIGLHSTSVSSAQIHNYLPENNNLKEVLQGMQDLLSQMQGSTDGGEGPRFGAEGARRTGPGLDVKESWVAGDSKEGAGNFGKLSDAPSLRRDVLSMQLIENWEIIGRGLALRPFSRNTTPTGSQLNMQKMLKEPIHLIRMARNSVAHSQPISDEDLEAAVAMSNRVRKIVAEEA